MDKYIKKGIIGAVAGIALMASVATSAFVLNAAHTAFESFVAGINVAGALCTTAYLLIKSFKEE